MVASGSSRWGERGCRGRGRAALLQRARGRRARGGAAPPQAKYLRPPGALMPGRGSHTAFHRFRLRSCLPRSCCSRAHPPPLRRFVYTAGARHRPHTTIMLNVASPTPSSPNDHNDTPACLSAFLTPPHCLRVPGTRHRHLPTLCSRRAHAFRVQRAGLCEELGTASPLSSGARSLTPTLPPPPFSRSLVLSLLPCPPCNLPTLLPYLDLRPTPISDST